MRKIRLLAILMLISIFSFSQVEKEEVFRGSTQINIYTTNFDQYVSLDKFCEFLSNDFLIPMTIYGNGTKAQSDSLYIDYKGRKVYSKIFVESELINDTTVLRITGFTKVNTWSNTDPTYMEYLSEQEDRYSKGKLFKYIDREILPYYYYKEKVTYSK